jgi:hypothetical protein
MNKKKQPEADSAPDTTLDSAIFDQGFSVHQVKKRPMQRRGMVAPAATCNTERSMMQRIAT